MLRLKYVAVGWIISLAWDNMGLDVGFCSAGIRGDWWRVACHDRSNNGWTAQMRLLSIWYFSLFKCHSPDTFRFPFAAWTKVWATTAANSIFSIMSQSANGFVVPRHNQRVRQPEASWRAWQAGLQMKAGVDRGPTDTKSNINISRLSFR